MEDSIVSLIEQLSTRLDALEHTVNDTIIGGWKAAEDEYKDNEAFDTFNTKYGADLEPLKPNFTVLYGDDFDLPREMYNQLKQTEGYGTDDFDEDGLVHDKILELTEKFKNLNKSEEPKETEVVVEEKPTEAKDEEEKFPSDEELKELYHKNVN